MTDSPKDLPMKEQGNAPEFQPIITNWPGAFANSEPATASA